MVGEKGFSGRLFSRLAAEGINVFLITQASSQHSISIAIAPRDIVLPAGNKQGVRSGF
jgi:bifunctional aspartokinase / homoserine dehydrogenase 1